MFYITRNLLALHGTFLRQYQTGVFILPYIIENEIIQSGCKLNDFIDLSLAVRALEVNHVAHFGVQSHLGRLQCLLFTFFSFDSY